MVEEELYATKLESYEIEQDGERIRAVALFGTPVTEEELEDGTDISGRDELFIGRVIPGNVYMDSRLNDWALVEGKSVLLLAGHADFIDSVCKPR